MAAVITKQVQEQLKVEVAAFSHLSDARDHMERISEASYNLLSYLQSQEITNGIIFTSENITRMVMSSSIAGTRVRLLLRNLEFTGRNIEKFKFLLIEINRISYVIMEQLMDDDDEYVVISVDEVMDVADQIRDEKSPDDGFYPAAIERLWSRYANKNDFKPYRAC